MDATNTLLAEPSTLSTAAPAVGLQSDSDGDLAPESGRDSFDGDQSQAPPAPTPAQRPQQQATTYNDAPYVGDEEQFGSEKPGECRVDWALRRSLTCSRRLIYSGQRP